MWCYQSSPEDCRKTIVLCLSDNCGAGSEGNCVRECVSSRLKFLKWKRCLVLVSLGYEMSFLAHKLHLGCKSEWCSGIFRCPRAPYVSKQNPTIAHRANKICQEPGEENRISAFQTIVKPYLFFSMIVLNWACFPSHTCQCLARNGS